MPQTVTDRRRNYMIQCYFGNGKGKTTAVIGGVIRCAGCSQNVLYVGFLKNNDSGEFNILKDLKNIDILFSDKHYNLYDNTKEELTSEFAKAYTNLLFEKTGELIEHYKMVVLDEVLDAVEFGYIDEKDFIKLLIEWKHSREIILTGHELPEKIAKVCDYISEIREINHPHTWGVPSRKGIEY